MSVTNFEKLQAMSLEELAEYLGEKETCDMCINNVGSFCVAGKGGCEKGHKKWLESEVDDETT